MKKLFFLVPAFCAFFFSFSQNKTPKKYPSLFWEITGNGLPRPSYLFGTMHVSSKMAFHLPDSFYLGIKSVDVVALETNPESWQEDLVKYEIDNSYTGASGYWNNYRVMPDDYLNIQTLRFDKYEKQIELALYSRPSTINNLLYRNYSDYSSDFEENTYLDMYIYQVGKKMGKRVAGVEKYDESMKLMLEAYRDASKDRNRKERSFDRDDYFSPDKLQEAYRTGNLDLLDSINRLNSISEAFDEKFLFKRNELQANSIDSILRSGSSLFVGVGAAHLPNSRGVIEMLRGKGYTLRPIIMGERDSRHKDLVEKLRVPVNFTRQASEDGFYKLDIPGKLFRFGEEGLLDQLQYADMANGSYYMATRIKTNSQFWGHNAEIVKKKIDSVLYENIPGKILNKEEIVRNGYKGFDITNRTRRGDLQRYNIFITPHEVIIFKMSGNGDYVKEGDEAKRFFSSIELKEYRSPVVTATAGWKKYQPPYGGFSVSLPYEPFVSKNVNWQYEAEDKSTGNFYTIIRTDVHNYGFAEEDSFDLGLLDESFSSSEFIDRQVIRKQKIWKGYPALDCKYIHKNGSVILARFIIQGPHYYTLVAQGKRENAGMQTFLNSFEVRPFIYGEPSEKKDTLLFYSVKTSFHPEDKKIKLSIPANYRSSLPESNEDDDEVGADNLLEMGTFRNNVIENDSTGEKIYVSFYKSGRYFYNDDTASLGENRLVGKKTSWIIRDKKKYELPGKVEVVEFQVSDTNSSRLIRTKSFYRDGIGFFLATEGDTLTAPSSFIKNFFETFTPVDTLKGINLFEKKSKIFFDDFFSKDTVAHKRAVNAIGQLKVDPSDFPQLKKAIESLGWNEKRYLDLKKLFIAKLGNISSSPCADYLKHLYYAAGDTIELQYVALESLLQQQTKYSHNIFKDIITIEPPVLDESPGSSYRNLSTTLYRRGGSRPGQYSNGDFWDELYDSIQLTRNILPDLLPLLNIDDYKWRTMRLLGRMIDSNLVVSKDYDIYFNKFLIEAKQELKKQAINEKKKSIQKASNKDERSSRIDEVNNDNGNDQLSLYAKLLLPFYETNANVPPLFRRLLESNDKKLKYSTMLLMLRNNMPVPDTLVKYFAAMDDYRYELYNDLEEMDELKSFPSQYNNHLDLAKSKLLGSKSYGKPDSVQFLERIPTEFRGRQGYIYFYKYKEKKDDVVWKLATVGLLPKDLRQFTFSEHPRKNVPGYILNEDEYLYREDDDFTAFSETKLKEDESLTPQLRKHLKKMLYSKRKSAREFYDERKNSFDLSSFRVRD